MLTIGELARLAGTTVRAVRYYHAVGALAEPPREANGYRRYGPDALVRLVRIRRLRELGIPLARVRAVLDGGAEFDGMLAALDAELAAQADEIGRQRDRIAGLRAGGADPDLPEPLGELFAKVAAMYGDSAELDREKATILLVLALAPESLDDLVEVYRRLLGDADLAARLRELDRRFGELAGEPVDSPAVEELVEAVLTDPDVRAELAAAAAEPAGCDDTRTLRMLDEHMKGYAPAQHRFITLAMRRADATIRALRRDRA